MMKYFYKWLYNLFGGKVKIISMSEDKEQDIMLQRRSIDGSRDYWELQKQAGYQLYGKSNDRTFLGWSKLAEHILINLNREKAPEEKIDTSDGYDSILDS